MVIVCNVKSKFYYLADILPFHRYFALQTWISMDEVNVNQKLMKFLRTEHPLWVVIYAGEEDEILPEILPSLYYLRGSEF